MVRPVIPPPPTKFGRMPHVQPKSQGVRPPPTRFSQAAPVQAKPLPHGARVVQPADGGPAKQKSAQVTLDIGGVTYDGTSSGQYGHAEMSTLRDFIIAQGSLAAAAAALTAAAARTVSCHNQPVCPSCSLILQTLNFATADAQTVFGDKKSGGVSWGANMKVKDFMKHLGHQGVYDTALEMGAK